MVFTMIAASEFYNDSDPINSIWVFSLPSFFFPPLAFLNTLSISRALQCTTCTSCSNRHIHLQETTG